MLFWLFLVILLPYYYATGIFIDQKLSRYDLVYPERKLVKRGIENPNPSGYNRIEQVTFNALGRKYKLYLTPKRGLLDGNFRAIAVDNIRQQQKLIPISPDEFLEGHLYGVPNSRVTASFDPEGALTGSLEIDDDTIMFEPAWRHVKGATLNATLVYRVSDMKRQEQTEHNHSYCGFIQADAENMVNNSFFEEDNSRPKRQANSNKNRCSLKIVADYHFFKDVGDKSTALATRYLINLIDRVNVIYTNTQFGQGIDDVGFMVKEVIVHQTPTHQLNHYNMEVDQPWAVDHLLRRFTEEEGSSSYCLVHLFTSQPFNGGVLGLGYIASPRIGTSGGVCSAATTKGSRRIFYNTALSSLKSTYGDTVITREADIVTAHEFGHNWGSPHDPTGEECSPTLSKGGSFIMHTYSVSGYDPNNKKFSPCSKRSMKAVLDTKLDLCFTERQERFCGNQRVEKGSRPEDDEQCDAGLLSEDKDDKCCTHNCKLKNGALCSPKNSPCCTEDCQYKQKNTLCQVLSENECRQESYCNGYSADCPPARPLPDRTLCLDAGECQKGVCVSFCEKESIRKVPCICENVTDSCYRCCRPTDGLNKCKPYRRSVMYRLRDGMPCIHGYCQNGICKKEVQDLIQHLWNIIEKLDSNTFWAFIRSNLVGTIIILTLIIWIPASCLVHHVDKKRTAKRRKNMNAQTMAPDAANVDIVREIKSVNYNPWAIHL